MINFKLSIEEAKYIYEILNISQNKEFQLLLKEEVENIDNIIQEDYSLWDRLDNLIKEHERDDI